jgi:PHD/YefM family antitoxin component YafN of YafNO toxin-antitoxin module
MASVSATDFQRNPRRYQDAALREPVTITAGGRERLVLLSPDEYHRLKQIDDILAGRQKPERPEDDPLAPLLRQLHAKVEADRLTAAEVDAELEGYNAEGRH